MEYRIIKNTVRPNPEYILPKNVFLFYGLLLIISIIVRVYRISQESISLEEYACIANLGIDSIWDFIKKQRETYPYGGILFPLLQYIWSWLLGTDIVSLRVFSLIFWILFYILLSFALKKMEQKQLLPVGVCLFTCVGIVLSPALIFLSQEARMYMTYIFFAWCSFILFIKIITDKPTKFLLLLWFLSNQILLWTHHTAIVLWATEFIIAILFLWQDKVKLKEMAIFILLHCICLLPWFVWIITIPPQPKELHQYYLKPTTWNLLQFPFMLNLVNLGGICPSGVTETWKFLPSPLAQILNNLKQYFSYVLMILAISGFAGLCLATLYNLFQRNRRTFSLLLSLILFFTLPPLMLFVLAQIGPPIFTTRYIVFLLPVHFLGLGLLASKTSKIIKYFLLIVVICSLLYQLGLMIPGPWRMDWKGVGTKINKQASTHDLVLIHDPFWTIIYSLNNKDINLPVSDAFTEEGLAILTKKYLLLLNKKNIHASYVWIIEPDVHALGTSVLSPILSKQGLSYSTECFPGEQKIWLYKVSIQNKIEEHILTKSIIGKDLIKRILKENEDIFEALYKKHRFDHDRTEFQFIRTAIILSRHHHYELAEQLLQTAWERNPNLIIQCYEWLSRTTNTTQNMNNYLSDTFWQGIQCFYEGEYSNAIDIFETLTKNETEEPLYWWLLANTYDKQNKTALADFCWQELFHLQPVLPLGWHIIYTPAVITWNNEELKQSLNRSQHLNIITDHLSIPHFPS